MSMTPEQDSRNRDIFLSLIQAMNTERERDHFTTDVDFNKGSEYIQRMITDGCEFPEDSIDLIAFGDYTEMSNKFSHYDGFNALNDLLDEIWVR